MEISILVTLMLSSLLGVAPNVCDDAHLDAAGEPITDSTGRTLARHCEWTGPDAPTLEANVCCSIGTDDSVSCQLANLRGYCRSGTRMWCEHGEVDSATGAVNCMQVFPDACDAGFCVQAPHEAVQGNPPQLLCCDVGGCIPISIVDSEGCMGEFAACLWGMTMADGTVECFD